MSRKRLHKSTDAVVCGVCGGIAEYFGIDPTLVRILTLVLFIVGLGFPILIYVVCMIVMPPDPGIAQGYVDAHAECTQAPCKRIYDHMPNGVAATEGGTQPPPPDPTTRVSAHVVGAATTGGSGAGVGAGAGAGASYSNAASGFKATSTTSAGAVNGTGVASGTGDARSTDGFSTEGATSGTGSFNGAGAAYTDASDAAGAATGGSSAAGATGTTGTFDAAGAATGTFNATGAANTGTFNATGATSTGGFNTTGAAATGGFNAAGTTHGKPPFSQRAKSHWPTTVWFGAVLIAIGVIALLSNLVHFSLWRCWPIVIVVAGLVSLFTPGSRGWSLDRAGNSLVLISVGLALLAWMLQLITLGGFIEAFMDLWPVLLVVAGLSVIGKAQKNSVVTLLSALLLSGTILFGVWFYAGVDWNNLGASILLMEDVGAGDFIADLARIN